MKVLISCQFFRSYTGSELSVFETAKELKRQGVDVSIITQILGNPLYQKAKDLGIKVYDIKNSPKEEFDILHINHKPIGEQVLKLYPNTKAVMHVRSEVIPVFEQPIINDNIKKYISIRPSITEYIKSFGIKEDKIIHVDNPFDINRFNMDYDFLENQRERVLFVGTFDHLRKEMLYHILTLTKKTKKDLWLVGSTSSGGYVHDLVKHDNVKYFGVRDDVEKLYKICDYTVGIFQGRTTIEGWLCGLPAHIYNVDTQGKILSKKLVDVPDDLDKYNSKNVVEKLINVYNGIIYK